MKLSLLDKIRQNNPVVLTVANTVTIAEVANAVNAIGASPIMSQAKEEAEELVGIAGAVTLNMGTWTAAQVEQMLVVGQFANQQQRPVIVDPVAVGLPTRHQQFERLIGAVHPTVIRANAGEMAALSGDLSNSKGIDATGTIKNAAAIAKDVAQHFHCIAVMTGETDFVSDGQRVVSVHVGTPLFATHVGSGDMLSSVLGAFMAVETDTFEAAITATATFGASGAWVVEREQLSLKQPGTFGVALMDGLSQATVAQLAPYLKNKVVEES